MVTYKSGVRQSIQRLLNNCEKRNNLKINEARPFPAVAAFIKKTLAFELARRFTTDTKMVFRHFSDDHSDPLDRRVQGTRHRFADFTNQCFFLFIGTTFEEALKVRLQNVLKELESKYL